ncbi:hypothetical protein L1887_40679 [Cichorium endivia]|nr:hypothetical protein L1887_40679 [Cichorium endivia]
MYTDEWSPFCLGLVPFSIWDKKPMQIDTDDDDDELNDDDGVNDIEEDSEPEDGEILPDKDNVSPISKPVEQHSIPRPKENENMATEPRVKIPLNMNTGPSMELPVTNNPIPSMGEANGQSINSMGKETIIIDESTSVLPENSENSLELTSGINGDTNGKNSNNARANNELASGSRLSSSGPPSLSLPTSCFGSFPSRLCATQLGGSPSSTMMFNTINEGRVKRRRMFEEDNNMTFPNPFFNASQPNPSISRILHQPPPPPPPPPPPSDTDPSISIPTVNQTQVVDGIFEFGATIEVGKHIGIDIANDNPILAQIIGELGEQNGVQ